MKRTLALLVVVLTAVAANAQMPDLKLSPQVEKLSWMLGKWSGNMHWTMEGSEMDSTMTYENTVDGQFIRSTSVMDIMGMKMTESGFTGWDEKAKAYKSWTFTNFGNLPRTETGKLDGDTLVFTSDPWQTLMSPEPTVSRTTMKKVSDSEVKFILEFQQNGKFEKVGEGTFKKG